MILHTPDLTSSSVSSEASPEASFLPSKESRLSQESLRDALKKCGNCLLQRVVRAEQGRAPLGMICPGLSAAVAYEATDRTPIVQRSIILGVESCVDYREKIGEESHIPRTVRVVDSNDPRRTEKLGRLAAATRAALG